MPKVSKELVIPFVVGEEAGPPLAENEFSFYESSKNRIEENWFIRNYFLYDVNGTREEKEEVYDQRHVDIRTFAAGSQEKWTGGTIGPVEKLNNLPGMALALSSGTTTVSSVAGNVNLSSEFTANDFIILAMPEYPNASITQASSFVDFTSHPTGDFTAGPTVSVKFSESLNPLSENEFRIERGMIEKGGLNLAQITGIRFRIAATASVPIYLSGLRLIDKNWGYTPLDFDNWNGEWRKPVPPNGNLAAPKAYNTQPILWRSAHPPSTEDPTIIDSRFGVIFFTGSQTGSNSFTLYLRELSEAFITQIDLNGELMAEIDAPKQPDLGISKYAPREIGELDKLHVKEMDKHSVQSLERIEDPVYQSWISFTTTWGPTNTVSITNSAEKGYHANHPAFANSTYYIALISLEDTGARLKIHQLNPDFSINHTAIYDSTLIKDGGLFKRRKGRVGWKASFEDGDAFMGAVHPRGLTFAEFVSAPLKSRTPVRGASLTANYSPNLELFTGLLRTPVDAESTLLDRDNARTLSGSSYRITNNGGTEQGVQTNIFSLTDLAQSGISFDVWYPSSMPGLKISLENHQGAKIPVVMPHLYRDQWQHINLQLDDSLVHTGNHILVIEQPLEGAGVWWLDNISVFERSIQWSARSIAQDPWETREAPWTDFRDVVNGKGSVMFSTPGNELQFRAKARQQDSIITGTPQIKPQYSQLGRLVWPENKLKPVGPTALFTNTSTSPEVTLELIKFPEKPDPERGDLAIDSNFVYWTDEEHGGAEETGSVRRGPIAGGAASTLIKSTAEILLTPKTIATDATYIYLNNNKKIARAKLNGTAVEESWVTVPGGTEVASVKGVAVDSTYVYWTDNRNNQIGRVKLNGTGAEVLVKSITKPRDIVVTSTAIYWVANKNVIEKSALDGTGRSILYSRPGTILGLAANSTKVFWTYYYEGISVVAMINQDGTELVDPFVSGVLEPGGIGANGSYVYWVNGEAVSRAALGSNPLVVNYTSTSTAGTYPISLYEWNFGDGNVGLGSSISHTYAKPGSYTITLTVVDSFGLRNSFLKSVTI